MRDRYINRYLLNWFESSYSPNSFFILRKNKIFDYSCGGCSQMIVENKKKKIKSILIKGLDPENLNKKINEFYKTILLEQFQYITEVKNDGIGLYVLIGISD